MSNVQDGSSTEVDELKAKLASTKETLQGEIKVREEVRNTVKQFICIRYINTQITRKFHFSCFHQQLAKAKERISELEKQLRDNLPVDVGKELEACQAKVVSEIL